MKGHTFLEIWEKLRTISFTTKNNETVLAEDFYELSKGTSLADVWFYIEEHFEGVTMALLLYDYPNWKSDLGAITYSD